MKTKLIGSAGSLEQLKELVGRFFYSKDIAFTLTGANEWTVSNGSKNLDGVRVVFKKGRYRFEMETV